MLARRIHDVLMIAVFAHVLLAATDTSAQVNYEVITGFDQSVPAATQPAAGVIKGADGAFYGTTANSNTCGAIYKIAADGTRDVLHVFHGAFATPPDGCQPVGELVEGADGFLWGATGGGGANRDNTIVAQAGTGTIYRISPAGDAVFYEIVHSFAGRASNGAFPEGIAPAGGLTRGYDGNFYGTTSYGGTGGEGGAGGGCTPSAGLAGTVYQITLSKVFSVKHAFDPATDGCGPMGNLTLLVDGSFVGSTFFGGFTQTASFAGTVFRVTTDGSFNVLFMFPGNSSTGCAFGGAPTSAPSEATDGSLFGTTSGCGFAGDSGQGTVYKLSAFGSLWEPTLLHRFTGADGSSPAGGVTLDSDGSLYGVTRAGGPISNGTVFRMTPNGVFNSLHTFGCLDLACSMFDPNDGFVPRGQLLKEAPGVFVGTTLGGNGSTIGGSVFRIATPSATSTTLASSANSAVFGQSVIFTATVSGQSGTPTGDVEFFDGSASLGTAALIGGQAQLAKSFAVGAHSVSARYLGNGTLQQSTSSDVSIDVDRAATAALLASTPNPSTRKQVVTLTATIVPVAPGGGAASGQVQFFEGKKKLGTATLANGVATLPVAFNGMGSHDVTATYPGDANFTGSTSPVFMHVVSR